MAMREMSIPAIALLECIPAVGPGDPWYRDYTPDQLRQAFSGIVRERRRDLAPNVRKHMRAKDFTPALEELRRSHRVSVRDGKVRLTRIGLATLIAGFLRYA